MSEPTLSLKKADYDQGIGAFLGYRRGADAGDPAWTTSQAANIREVMIAALDRFYHHAVILETGNVHSWTFLRPYLEFTLASGESELKLPDDFARIEGQIVVSSAAGTVSTRMPVDLYGEPFVMQQFALNPSATGQPQYAAVASDATRGPTLNNSDRKKLICYPTADQDWTLGFTYKILPDCLTGTHPYAYGGAEHTGTIKAGCIAAAELYLDDSRGVREQYYQELLAASIAADRKAQPHVFGPNRDTSDDLYWTRRSGKVLDRPLNEITFGGISYNT